MLLNRFHDDQCRARLAALPAGDLSPFGCGPYVRSAIVQSFAEAVTAVVYIERNPQHGQIVREIVEVSPIVERTAGRPSFSPLFRFDTDRGLLSIGNRPMRTDFLA